jgi:hypothetical protein
MQKFMNISQFMAVSEQLNRPEIMSLFIITKQQE